MRKMPFLQNDVSTSRLIVNAVSSDASFAGDVTYAWYGPADGLITGAVAHVTYPSAAVFEGLTPGRRILKAYRTTNGAQSGCSHVQRNLWIFALYYRYLHDHSICQLLHHGTGRPKPRSRPEAWRQSCIDPTAVVPALHAHNEPNANRHRLNIVNEQCSQQT